MSRSRTLRAASAAPFVSGAFAIIVVAVTMPSRCARMIPCVTPRVYPKSSALTMSFKCLSDAPGVRLEAGARGALVKPGLVAHHADRPLPELRVRRPQVDHQVPPGMSQRVHAPG